jgi:hypothetical protein
MAAVVMVWQSCPGDRLAAAIRLDARLIPCCAPCRTNLTPLAAHSVPRHPGAGRAVQRYARRFRQRSSARRSKGMAGDGLSQRRASDRGYRTRPADREGEEVRFASDSPLEGGGFELPVRGHR